MAQRRVTTFLAVTLATLILAAPAIAGAKKFAVLPFEYNGPAKYQYLSKAFQASLTNDLEWLGHVEPSMQDTESAAAPKGKADALNELRSMNVDYLVYGSIAVISNDAHIKLEAISADGKSWQQKGEMGMDAITGWLDKQSQNIQGDVFNRPGYGTLATQKQEEAQTVNQATAPTSSNFIPAEAGTFTSSALNPQFRYEGGTGQDGRWRSQTLRFSSYGIQVADGDADGQNEVFLLHKDAISAYRYKDGKLQHLTTFEMASNLVNMRMEFADLNRDGLPEIIIGAYRYEGQPKIRAPRGEPRSSILTFSGGKFRYVVEHYNKFLGILRLPPTYMPILVAQKKGQRHLFDPVIREAFVKGDSIELGQRIKVPPFGNIYNMTYLPKDLGYQILVINNKHNIVTYSQTYERLNETDQTFNSSGIAIYAADKMLGMGGGATEDRRITYNIPFRMLTAPLTSNTRYELLVNKDLSASAQVFESYHYYTQGEIHSLVWDGVGLNLAWKTRRIKGQVGDIALADINNDGNKQLVVLVNTFAGIGYGNRKTVVIAYDLNMQ